MVDSSDKLRMAVAKNELELMLAHEGKSKRLSHACLTGSLPACVAIKTREVPVLFFANKMDLPFALKEVEVAKEL